MSKKWIVPVVATSALLALANLAAAKGGGDTGIFAGSREIRVTEAALFAGRDVEPGTYRLAWEMLVGTDRAEVRLYKGKTLVGTARGGFVTLESTSPYDTVGYARGGSGKLELTEIRFAQSRHAISLKDATPAAAAQP